MQQTSAPRTRAAALLAGAAVLVLLVEAAGVRFFHVPLLLGAVLLVAAAAGRSRGPLWAPGWVLTAVGATEALWLQDGRPADSFQLVQLTLLAAGTGALLATLMSRAGVVVPASSLALAVLLTGALSLAQATDLPGVAGNTWLYAGLLVAGAGLTLRDRR